MADASVRLAEDIRLFIDDLYQQQHQRNVETNGGLANIVLAGLTLVWLESVYQSWNTVHGESAMSLLRVLRPRNKGRAVAVRRSGRDFLRRSGWWIRRGK